jgi:hypothetical protein
MILEREELKSVIRENIEEFGYEEFFKILAEAIDDWAEDEMIAPYLTRLAEKVRAL